MAERLQIATPPSRRASGDDSYLDDHGAWSDDDVEHAAETMNTDQLATDAHILVVEDDAEMRVLMVRVLRQNGYRVTGVRDGREMWETLNHAAVDLILLDVMLPGTSGLDLTRSLRGQTQVPIIMVTARGDEADRVLGLELGADDYIAKPFSRPELLARIRAVLRRSQMTGDTRAGGARGDRILFAGWILDTRRRELMAPDGSAIDISGGEYDILLAFCEHPQRVLSRNQLLDLARGRMSDSEDRAVDVMVSRLRRKLEPSEDSPSIVKTVRGVGYLFQPTVTRA